MMITYQTRIKLHETDAAGVLFFSNQFKLIHDAYEALLERIGFNFTNILQKKEFFLPIVHSEADYKSPLFVGDTIDIRVTVADIGKTSFTLTYALTDSARKLIGTAKTVHVAVDPASYKKIPLPSDFRAKIEGLKE